jgi:hypothetical protein
MSRKREIDIPFSQPENGHFVLIDFHKLQFTREK